MKKLIFTVLVLIVLTNLFSLPPLHPNYFIGDELANRSDDPRITEIAHIHTNPTLNSYEIEAKTLWDSLFVELCDDANSSNKILEHLRHRNKIEYWTSMTPKQIESKTFNGARVFFMQNLRTFTISDFMCATYNSKIYLLPTHFNELLADMNISVQVSNLNSILRTLIDVSISSPVTVIDSTTVQDTVWECTRHEYNIWEQRNGFKHLIEVYVEQDTIIKRFSDRPGPRSECQNDSSVIADYNRNSELSLGTLTKGMPYSALSIPTRPVLRPLSRNKTERSDVIISLKYNNNEILRNSQAFYQHCEKATTNATLELSISTDSNSDEFFNCEVTPIAAASSNRVHNSSGYIRINNSHQVPISIPYSGLYQVLLNYENEEIERYFRVFDKITHAIGSQQADYSHIDFYTTNNSPTPYTDILDEFKDKIKQALLTYSDPGKYLAASPQSCDWKTYLNLQGNNLPVTYDVILLNDTPRFEWLNTDNGTGSIISAPGVQVERLPYSLNPTQNYHEHLVFHIPYIVSQISKRPYTLNQYIESLSLHEVFHSFQSSYQLVPNEISGKYFFFYEGMATAATFWEMKDEEKLLLEDSNGEIQFSCYKSAERQFYIKLAKDEFGHLFQGCRTPKDLTYGGAVFWRFLLEKGVKNHPNALGAPERVLTKFMEGVYWSSNAYDQNNVHEMLEDGYNYLLSPYGYNDCMVYQSFEELMQAYSEYAVTQALKLDNLLTDENVNEFLFGHNGLYQIYVPSAIDEGLTINNTMVPGVFGFDCYEIDIVGASFTRYDLKHDLANEPVSISILYEYDDGEENINRYEIDRIIKDELSSCIIDIADEEISNIKKIYVIISQYGQISTSGDLVKLQALKRPFNTSFSLDSTSSMADMSLFYSDPLTVQVTHPSAIYLA